MQIAQFIFHIAILFLLASTLSPQHQLLCWSTPSQKNQLPRSQPLHPPSLLPSSRPFPLPYSVPLWLWCLRFHRGARSFPSPPSGSSRSAPCATLGCIHSRKCERAALLQAFLRVEVFRLVLEWAGSQLFSYGFSCFNICLSYGVNPFSQGPLSPYSLPFEQFLCSRVFLVSFGNLFRLMLWGQVWTPDRFPVGQVVLRLRDAGMYSHPPPKFGGPAPPALWGPLCASLSL